MVILRFTRLSILALLCGGGILARIVLGPPNEKVAIVESAAAMFLILIGLSMINGYPPLSAHIENRWLLGVPLAIGILTDVLGGEIPVVVSACAFSATLVLVFVLLKVTSFSRLYYAFLVVFLAGSIGYSVFNHYPLDIGGPDSWGYLSIASAMMQTGHYSGILQPAFFANYYSPFPVVSIMTSIVSSLTGMGLLPSLMIAAGLFILLQPLLVFFVSRLLFNDSTAGVLSAAIVAMEPTVLSGINAPTAQAVAISFFLLVLLLLLRGAHSRESSIVTFVLFLALTVTHGAVAMILILLVLYLVVMKRSSRMKRMILPLVVVFLTYLTIAALLYGVVHRAEADVFGFIFTFTFRTGPELYPSGTSGLVFLWWGLPVALALFLVLYKGGEAWVWAFAGLSLLGVSFVSNVLDPLSIMDRYGGLPAWILLSISGGKALNDIVKPSRKALVLAPMVLMIALSAVINPVLSPQFGMAQFLRLPTTSQDREALGWVNSHLTNATTIVTDYYGLGYLTYLRYQSGRYSTAGVDLRRTENLIYLTPRSNYAFLVRWAYSGLPKNSISCTGFVLAPVNGSANLVYDGACEALVTAP